MNLELFIARKIHFQTPAKKSKSNITKPAVRIAIAGIALGIAVMIISVGVITGFKHEIRENSSNQKNNQPENAVCQKFLSKYFCFLFACNRQLVIRFYTLNMRCFLVFHKIQQITCQPGFPRKPSFPEWEPLIFWRWFACRFLRLNRTQQSSNQIYPPKPEA